MTQPAMIVLRPGDKVLVALTEDPDADACKAMLTELRRAFRGCDFTILTGVSAVAVQPGERPA
ncbi:hypothetical protein ACQEUU_37390 [Nonomuraea sp. CA-218870]|uniref:hypothetical protein n=1 Tax=Nonomuraea sp. CA-218870 TaxID=3239998 RepID=UPI003D8BC159